MKVFSTQAIFFLACFTCALAGTDHYEAQGSQYTAKVINNTDHFCLVHVKVEKGEGVL